MLDALFERLVCYNNEKVRITFRQKSDEIGRQAKASNFDKYPDILRL